MPISLGQAASHSAWLEQAPNPSASICLDHRDDPPVALGLALGEEVEVRGLGGDEEHGRGVGAGGHAGPAADAGGGVHGEVGVVLGDRDRVAVGGVAGPDAR